MSRPVNPLSGSNRRKIRDLEADLRGRGHVDQTGARSRLRALNPFGAVTREQVRDLEADLRGHGHVDADAGPRSRANGANG